MLIGYFFVAATGWSDLRANHELRIDAFAVIKAEDPNAKVGMLPVYFCVSLV